MSGNPPEHRINHHLDIAELLSRAEIQIDPVDFMSLHEAVHLVLESGATGHNGDLCILDMGEPVRILDLAETLIRMKGREPERDIPLVFTGMGPGEKLEDQMFSAEETRNVEQIGKLRVCRLKKHPSPLREDLLENLRQAALHCRRPEIIHLLKELIPSYTPS